MTDELKVNSVLEGLMERRTVVLEGAINHSSISEVSARLLELQTQSDDEVTLMISSGGGELYPALELCDLVKTLMSAPVRGIAIGECGSAATLIMLHCKQRLGFPYSRYLIHSGNLGGIDLPIGRATSKVTSQLLAEVTKTEKLVTGIYTDMLTPKSRKKSISEAHKKEYVQRLLDRGNQHHNEWMSVQEALEIGLIEEVVTDPKIY
ncbi:MAG: ATP-dependent protease ClpP protease subunit [Candidatus Paceibacteria bacterium]|jgi:ATP-dependent protease ClpP protease subunit